MKPKQKCKEAYDAVNRHGKFKQHPWQRIGGLLLSMIADRTLPNVMIGAFLTSQINYMAGAAPQMARDLTFIAFILSVLFHGIADEITQALKALSNEVSENEQTNRQYE